MIIVTERVDDFPLLLVVHHSDYTGYNRFSLVRAVSDGAFFDQVLQGLPLIVG